jgi:hypothetical protein
MLNFTQFTKQQLLKEEKLQKFINFASDELGLQEIPTVLLVNTRDNNMTTANYCPNTKKIKIYSKGRAFFDIARSIAHELMHHSQLENGEELDGSTGSDCENAANAVAGQIIRKYGEKNPDFYE